MHISILILTVIISIVSIILLLKRIREKENKIINRFKNQRPNGEQPHD